MKVLVTGHRGFLGAAFCERFARSYDFVGYDLKDGDDLHDLDRLVERMEGCDQVVHLAAIPRPVEGEPLERFFEENVVATLGVLRTAERAGCGDSSMRVPLRYTESNTEFRFRRRSKKTSRLYPSI